MKTWRICITLLALVLLAQPFGACTGKKGGLTGAIPEHSIPANPKGHEGSDIGGGIFKPPLRIELVQPSIGHRKGRTPEDRFIPYIQDLQPYFIAAIESDDSNVLREDITMRLNGKAVDFGFDEKTGEITWYPDKQLAEGNYLVDIWARDGAGNRAMDFWQLRLDVTPPKVGMVFSGDEPNELLLSLSEPEYSDLLEDLSYWNSEKEKDDKKTGVSVTRVELVGDNSDMVRLTLSESFEREEGVSRRIEFNGPRGTTWVNRLKPGEKKREISDQEYLYDDCTDYINPDPIFGNTLCPPYTIGTVRVGDMWRDVDESPFPDVFHVHQSQESENHCVGTQTLGTALSGTSVNACFPCGYRDERASVNINNADYTLIGHDEDLAGEQPLFADRCEEMIDLWPVNLSELQVEAPGFPIIRRDISTRYMDYGEIGNPDCTPGPTACSQVYQPTDYLTLINAWQWEVFGDSFNPEFQDIDGTGTLIDFITGEEAEQIAQDYEGTESFDFSDCAYFYFVVRDVGCLDSLGWMGEMPVVDIAVFDETNPTTRDFCLHLPAAGWKDLDPVVQTVDVDGREKEEWLFLIPYEQVVADCVSHPNCALDVCEPGPFFFLISDDVGNWKVETYDPSRQISDEQESGIEFRPLAGGTDWFMEDHAPIYVNWDSANCIKTDQYGTELQFEIVFPQKMCLTYALIWWEDPDEPDLPPNHSSGTPNWNDKVYPINHNPVPHSEENHPFDSNEDGSQGQDWYRDGDNWIWDQAYPNDNNGSGASFYVMDGVFPNAPSGTGRENGILIGVPFIRRLTAVLNVSSYGGDNYIIHAEADCATLGSPVQTGTITVWRKVWYTADYMSQAPPPPPDPPVPMPDLLHHHDEVPQAFSAGYFLMEELDNHDLHPVTDGIYYSTIPYDSSEHTYAKYYAIGNHKSIDPPLDYVHEWGKSQTIGVNWFSNLQAMGTTVLGHEHSLIATGRIHKHWEQCTTEELQSIENSTVIHELGHQYLGGDEAHTNEGVMAALFVFQETPSYFVWPSIERLRREPLEPYTECDEGISPPVNW